MQRLQIQKGRFNRELQRTQKAKKKKKCSENGGIFGILVVLNQTQMDIFL